MSDQSLAEQMAKKQEESKAASQAFLQRIAKPNSTQESSSGSSLASKDPSKPWEITVPLLDDDAILSQGEDGSDLLHFATRVGGKIVRLHYPRWGQRTEYAAAVWKMIRRITPLEDYELGDMSAAQVKRPFAWAEMCAAILAVDEIWTEIEDAFYKYLRPTVDDVKDTDMKQWIAENAGLDWPIRVLCALLVPMESVKKNARYAMTLLHQR